MAKSEKAYLGLPWIISVILAIVPFTNIVGGIWTRVERGNILMAVLNFVLAPIWYAVDLVSIVFHRDIKWLV